jgi:Mrp family chromosome partitioning ATPase
MSLLDRAFVKAFDRRPVGIPHARLVRADLVVPSPLPEPVSADVEPRPIPVRLESNWTWPAKSRAVLNATRVGFERLAEQLVEVARARSVRSVGFMSPSRGHGRTTTLLALAQVLVEIESAGVLLVDADVGHPEIASLLEVAPPAGLFDAACGDAALDDAVLELLPDRLSLLAECGSSMVGQWTSERYPAALTVLEMLRPRFDLTLVDVGPWTPMNWSSVWYRGAIDAVVCVASTRSERRAMSDGELVSQLAPVAIEYLGRIETSV